MGGYRGGLSGVRPDDLAAHVISAAVERTLYDTTLGWRMINPKMAERHSTEAMGETGENVAEKYGVSREEQDRFALQSHERAVAARDEGRFDDQIVPVEVPPKSRREEP